jgi:hypothetical protein
MAVNDYKAALASTGLTVVEDWVAPRHIAFYRQYRIPNANYSVAAGTTWAGQVRLIPDAADPAIVTFTIAAIYNAGHTYVTIQCAAPRDIAGIPAAGEAGSNAILHYDIHMDPPGSEKQILFAGNWIVAAGITQP